MSAFSTKLLSLILCCFSISAQGFTQIQINEPTGTGSFSLTVSDAATNIPLPNISVEIYDTNATFIKTVLSDAQGNIISGPLPEGSYYIKSIATDTYVSKVYPTTLCMPSCDVTTGFSFTVRSNTTLFTTSNFKLESGGLISGIITDVDSGDPLQDIGLLIYDSEGTKIATANTDASGRYISHPDSLDKTVLPGGNYYVVTFNSAGYFDESYDDVDFNYNNSPYDFTSSTLVTVRYNKITTGIDFSLKKGGRISGSISNTDSGEPLQNISLIISNENGSIVANGWSDVDGNYITTKPLTAGAYYLYTANKDGYINQIYDGNVCMPQCDSTYGTPVLVEESKTTNGINFSLKKGGQIAGIITDAITGQPLQDISLSVYDDSGSFVSNGWSDTSGHYLTEAGLTSGDYYVYTGNRNGYINERFNDLVCRNLYCNAKAGTAIKVTEGQVTPSIDFALKSGGRIAGLVFDYFSATAIDNVAIYTYDDSGTLLDISYTQGISYVTGSGLPPGNYYIHTDNNLGYINQRYQFQPLASTGTITDSTPVVVTGTNITTGVDFLLHRGSRISGRVTNVETHLPFSGLNLRIDVFDREGDLVSRAYPNDNGDYLSGAAVPPGEYFVRAYDTAGKLVSQFYPAKNFTDDCIEWQRCNIQAGTLVTVMLGSDTTDIDFSLSLKKTTVTNTNNTSGGTAVLSAALLVVLVMVVFGKSIRQKSIF